jgi:hypothetical protein
VKVKRPMRRLSKADVQFVSLVDRGANRIPFRIVKRAKSGAHQEQPMSINLSNPALIFKGERPQVSVSAIVTKDEPSAEYLASLKAAGFKTDVKKAEDGTFTIMQDAALPAPGTETLVRAGEGTILVMKGFKSWSDALETFSDFLNAKGYYSGVCTATDALRCCLDDILSDVASPEDAAPRVEQALTDFHEYIMTLIKALPAVAFKAEHIARKAEVAAASGGVKPMVTTASVAAAGTTEGKGALAPNSDAGYAGGSEKLDAKATTGTVAAAGTDSGAATIAPDNKLPNGTSQAESAGAAGNTDKLDAKGTTGAVNSAGTQNEAARVAAGDISGASSDKKVDPKAAQNEAGLTGMNNLDGMPIHVTVTVARKADGSLDVEAMQAAAGIAAAAALEQVQKQGNAERAKNLKAVEKAKPDEQMAPTGKDAQDKNAEASKNAGSKVNKDEGAAPALDAAAITAAVTAAIAPVVERVTKLEGHLTATVDGIAQKVEAVTQQQGETAAAAKDAVAKAEGAAAKLRNTVVGSALSTETPAAPSAAQGARRAKKSESDPRTGCFDTAYLKGRGGR